MKRILNIIMTLILASGIVYLFVFANNKQHDVICQSFEINIYYNDAPELIDKAAVRSLITENGFRIKGQPVTSIPVKKIQKLLTKNPYIKKATISISVNGIVKANILQRDPLLRIVDNNYNHFLIDHDGVVMPVNPYFPVRLVVANGSIENLRLASALPEKKVLPSNISGIYKIALSLEKDSLTSALIEQIYLNETGEYELVPKIGDHTIILGDTTHLSEKLRNLKLFYEESMKNLAWTNYKEINLKYKNQVVCSK